ncbi:MEDS domain-containing protein [Micromonospora endolithica]|uniref:STAS domain-containing protein n=1 Tax=Micromonospora endolithica TaxID=230091 RepID=A0A3A9YYV5_9ACTN|nr:MEDS domain-containing protein [Micromonospora endolithica]RKN41105.1 hypothetical protein D7223_25545 [Micromonospora endolithica]TWJ24334.1 DcmR-like sensory protein [Micromonospora endolithica]
MTGDDRLPGHVCWAYDDQRSFAVEAERFLLAGLAAGERVRYVTSGPADRVTDHLAGQPVFAAAVARGAAEVVSLASTYHPGGTVEPATQIATYAAATDAALAAGHTGLRVVADATDLVRTPAQREQFARYEHRIDRWMRTRPFRAMCAYNRLELGGPAVAELACLHPAGNIEDPLFRLFAAAPGAGDVELTGELDTANRQLFRTALDRADLRPVDGELVVRATALRFLDHHAMTTLNEYAHRRGATAVLRTSRPGTARLVSLLDLRTLRVEVTR